MTEPGVRKELRGLREARVPLDRAAEAAGKNDWATARAAFSEYTEAWNGIEQYVRVRSVDLYHAIEDPFGDINQQLESPSPASAEIMAALKNQEDQYGAALRLAEAGSQPEPVVDQVADIRILRLNLRAAQTALRKNDVAAARQAYRKFEAGWGGVSGFIRDKSSDAPRDIESAIREVNGALLDAGARDVVRVTQLLDALVNKYNDGLRLVAAGLPA